MLGNELLFVYEPEPACRARLERAGFSERHASEICSYLAQSAELEAEFDNLAAACDARGLALRPLPLDRALSAISEADPARAIVWTATDGIAYFHGSAAPALAHAKGIRTFGSDHALFSLCQDKFRSGTLLKALGVPVPEAGLARDGAWLVPPPSSRTGFFVKPNRLGSKIGIWEDSHCRSLDQALDLSRRVFKAYRDDAVVQPYVAGRNVRSSYLAVDEDAGSENVGSYFVDSGSDFQTMSDSLELYGKAGAAAKDAGVPVAPRLSPVEATRPEAARHIRAIAERLRLALGLRDVYSMDLRVEDDGTVHFIEFEVCPGITGFDFRRYCRDRWGLPLNEAIAAAAVRSVSRPPNSGAANQASLRAAIS